MSMYIYILLFASSWVRLEATIHKDILTYINDLRHLHSAGPLINSPTISAIAQKSADKFSKNGGDPSNAQFSTNHCVFKGRLSKLPKTCVVSWYTTIKDHSWCRPQRDGKARPFINMIWNTTTRAGIGVSQGKNGKLYVVVYFYPRKTGDVKQNVKPVKIVTKASPKAVCAKGYSRFGSSCFKFHPEKVTWEQAVIQCANENATLTSVRNRKEEKFLRDLQERGKGKGWMWIGLHDRLHEGHFAWLDGLDFAPGICAPVTTNGGSSQNCVAWTTNKPLSCWSDKVCSEGHPFMCRMPIEGKLTYRVEILFKKFRWNPNFRNKKSKAFKDLNLGTKVTFNELFQKSSGRIGGGIRGIKIKSVRPYTMQGRRRGTAVTLSLQFRSPLADPTVKLQKFLRPSERVLYVTVDSPVIHKSSIANTQCFFPCRKHGQSSCPTWSYTGYPNTGYHAGYHTGYSGYHTGYHNVGYHNGYQYTPCPTACTHYTYSCPKYCPHSCCSQDKQRTSPTSKSKPTNPPTQAATVATAVNTGTAKTPAPPTKAPAPVTQAPGQYNTQNNGYTSYQPYSQCNTCHLYSSPYCYAYCDEACCKHGNREGDLQEMLADMKENLKKFQAILKLGKNSDLPGFEGAEFQGNDVPLFGKKAKLRAVKTLKRNIEKLEEKIKRGKKHFENKSHGDFQGGKQRPQEVNAVPYFDDDDELSDISDDDDDDFDIEGELLELEEPEKQENYPPMSVHPDDKNIEHEKPDNYPNKHEQVGDRHPDSPPNIYENSWPHTNDTEEVESNPRMHPENKTTDFNDKGHATYHPDSPPTRYEQSLDTQQTTTNTDSYPRIHPNKTTDFNIEEHATYHPDSPTTRYEQSLDTQQTTSNTDSYPRMHPNKTTDFNIEKHATYHPDSPPARYEQSLDTQQTTTNTDSYPRIHPNKTTDFNIEENATYHPDSPPNSYEQSLDTQQTTTNTDSYPRIHPNKITDFNIEEHATYHPDSPPNRFEQSLDTQQTTTNTDSYPRMHPNKITDFNIEEHATYHPESPPTRYEHSLDTEKTIANTDSYPDDTEETGL